MKRVACLDPNPCAERLTAFAAALRRRRISAALVFGEANIRALTGVACDNGCLLVVPGFQLSTFNSIFSPTSATFPWCIASRPG